MNQAGAASGSVGTSSGGGGGGTAQLALTPSLESFEGDTLALPSVQAYVLQNNIADADALAQALQNQSSL
jgi:NAD(P)H-dependent FMN reductase